jgi:hypothetical protein
MSSQPQPFQAQDETTKLTRELSPGRPSQRSVTSIPQPQRKGSQEFSPTRNASTSTTVPSAAAVQRALSAHRPILPPQSVDSVLEGGQQTDRPTEKPSWPTSPRLKSPPPSKSAQPRTIAAKRSESELAQSQSNTSMKRLAPVGNNVSQAAAMQVDKDVDAPLHSSIRASARGPSTASTLETVAENSVPPTPLADSTATSPEESRNATPVPKSNPEVRPDQINVNRDDSAGEGSSKAATQSNGRRSRAPSSSRPGTDLAKRSFTNLTSSSKKSADPPRTMTVETETVSSIPQLLNPDRSGRDRDGNGSVRTKPSNETIRPKKKDKKPRKTPSLHSGTVTSKADLFEAKVASAVDEAESDDSDETFVYESNPPDTRPARHHSRTPSATSLADGSRSKAGTRSGSSAIPGKKSMKFSNSTYNNQLEGDSGPDGRGSQRNASTTPRHHHISRHSRPHHPSILDTDSPFTQASKSNSPRSSTNNLSRFGGKPGSPRNGRVLTGGSRKDNAFDSYEDAADDERAPLMGSVRINRTRNNGRRPYSSHLRQVDFNNESPERTLCNGWFSCMGVGFLIILFCVSISTFIMALNRPLLDVSVKHLQNVLASEQELMLDLHVQATNMNLFAITVNDLDVNIFAESPYAGTSSNWNRGGRQGQLRWPTRSNEHSNEASNDGFWPPWHSDDGVDEGTDPIDDEPGTQKMLLGRVLEFDSPLVFDASPIRRLHSSSIGEIRLGRPGNKTEVGGTARWERVLQHPFDLIVRGVIKYQLPLSSHTKSAKIGSRIKVLPTDDGDDKPDGGHNSTGNGSLINRWRAP